MSRRLPRRRTASLGSLLIAPARQPAEHDRSKEAHNMTDLASIFGEKTAAPATQPAAQPAAAPPAAAPAPAPAAAGGSWLDDIVTAEANTGSGGAPYANDPGTFIGKVLRIKHIPPNPETGKMTHAVALEVEVVASQTPEPYAKGTEWCMYRQVPGKFKSGAEDVKGWLVTLVNGAAAAAGSEAPAFTKDLLSFAVGDDQPFAGQYMKIQAFMNKGGTFTKYAVEYVPKSAVEGAAQ